MYRITKKEAKEILDINIPYSTIARCSMGQIEAKLEVGKHPVLDGLNQADMNVLIAALVLAGFKLSY